MKYFRGTHTKPIAIYKPKIMRKIKDLTLTTSEGTVLDFGEEIQTIDEVEVGLTATIDGAPADGSYILPDGRTFVFVAGELTEIKFPPDETTETMVGPNIFGEKIVYLIRNGHFLARAEPCRNPGKPVLGI